MHEHPDSKYLLPPGTYLETLPHPSGEENESVEMAVFKEHRFSFFFWYRWNQLSGKVSSSGPVHLVTIDWHRDLAPPSEKEKKALKQLDLKSSDEVASFSWSRLDKHNDSHLLAAAYLDFFDDVYLLKNYGGAQQSVFSDYRGNEHRIREFQAVEELEQSLSGSGSGASFLLDIDLDYFVKNKVSTHQLEEVELYSDEEIAALLNPDRKLFRHLLPRLRGLTIASEPRYCGGLLKSQQLLKEVLGRFFTPDMQWKHLESPKVRSENTHDSRPTTHD